MSNFSESIKKLNKYMDSLPFAEAIAEPVDELIYKGIKLELGSFACPEAYDVYNGKGHRIGYLRLRHGNFTVEYKNKIIYSATPKGDGNFYNEEREFYLTKAIEIIKEKEDE